MAFSICDSVHKISNDAFIVGAEIRCRRQATGEDVGLPVAESRSAVFCSHVVQREHGADETGDEDCDQQQLTKQV